MGFEDTDLASLAQREGDFFVIPKSADGGDSRTPTSLRSLTSNAPQSATGILCKSFYSQSHLSKLKFDCS